MVYVPPENPVAFYLYACCTEQGKTKAYLALQTPSYAFQYLPAVKRVSVLARLGSFRQLKPVSRFLSP